MCVIEQTPRIETRRLLLRAPEERDIGVIAEFCGDYDVARMTTAMPHPYRLEDAQSFLYRTMAYDPREQAIFLLEHENEGPVGMLGFHPGEDRFPEMGYWIGKPFWGRGFATEAAEAGLVWASRKWGRRAIGAGHFPDNPASGRVLTKAGFLYTGEVRTQLCVARRQPVGVRMMMWLA